jgi:endo-1,4-beta-xylanase
LSRILEFAVKVRVLKYKGVISIWDGCDEAADALFNPNNGKWSFWYDRLGVGIIHNSFVWAHQADPNAKLIIVDHPILESTKGAPPLETRVFEGIREKFFQLLRMFKERNTPVDGVDIENNFWIYAPPSYDYMVEILGKIKEMGYTIYAPETMVNMSEYYIPWRERSKQTSLVVDKETTQAQIYADVARAYLDIGAHIGFGGVNDGVNWMTIFVDSNANPTLFDKDGNPKKAYFSVKKVLEQKISTRTS